MVAPIGPGTYAALAMARPAETQAPAFPSPAAPSGAVPGAVAPERTSAAGDFAHRVADLLHHTNQLEQRADAAADGLVQGEHQDVHGTMIAMQEADVQFRLVTNIRNRVVEAYREVMRMGA